MAEVNCLTSKAGPRLAQPFPASGHSEAQAEVAFLGKHVCLELSLLGLSDTLLCPRVGR